MATELPPDFSEFLRSLRATGVEYLVLGGGAVGYHGYPRATGNIDVWIRAEPINAERVAEALRHFGFDVPELDASIFTTPGQIVRMGITPNRIEVLTSISGVDFDACWQERIDDEWDGVPVHVISLDRLKENKRASGRLKDLADLENLP